MDKETKGQFKKIDENFAELMAFLAENVATKEDLKNFVTKEDLKNLATKDEILRLETKMDEGFTSLRVEMISIRQQLNDLEKRVEKLNKRNEEDLKIFFEDFLDVKKHVQLLEKKLKKHGMKIPVLA